MPSTSPGSNAFKKASPTSFAQILPGAPTDSLQAFATFSFRFKQYVAYLSGSQLNILSSPNTLVQAITFNHDLKAIAADGRHGKLLVAGKKEVWVLESQTEGWTKVWWEKVLCLRREDDGDQANWLSWGDDGEALVGGDRMLSLFSTLPSSRSSSPAVHPVDTDPTEERRALWSKTVASPIRQAEFSPSTSLIASCGRYDRLVKIWRRLSFEEGLFDYMYLPHPGAVTQIQWRPMDESLDDRRESGVSSRHEDDPEILYTIANDGILRIWRTGGLHELEILTLHTTIDLVAAIPQSPSLTIKGQSSPAKAPRHAVVIPSEQFCAAVNAAIGVSKEDKVNHSKELLKEMVSNEPDVIVAFDGQGRMSAWGIQSIGHKRRPDTPTVVQAYHIAHAEATQLRLPSGIPTVSAIWFQDVQMHFLTHAVHDGGEINWWRGDVETVFSASSSGAEKFRPAGIWCGHDKPIIDIQPSGDCVVSRSLHEVTQWRVGSSQILKPSVSFGMDSNVLAATTINSGSHVLTLSANVLSLWNRDGQRTAKVACTAVSGGRFYTAMAKPNNLSGAFISDDVTEVFRWSVELGVSSTPGSDRLNVDFVPFSDQQVYSDVVSAIPVAMPFQRCKICIIALTRTGRVHCCLLPGDGGTEGDLEPFATFETGIEQAAVLAANEEFAALTSRDSKELAIVDLTDGYIEHRTSSSKSISGFACFTPRTRHSFLAVAYDWSIDILAQGRYEHQVSPVPVWLPVKSISIAGMGIHISGMSWMSNGSLAMAAENSILIASSTLELSDLNRSTEDAIDTDFDGQKVVQLPEFTIWLKDPLPAWHPSFLSHLLCHGHHGLAATFLRRLAQTLKFWSTGEELPPMLNEEPKTLIQQFDEHNTWLDDDTVADLKEQFEEKDLPRTSRVEQERLKHILEALVYLREHVKGLDRNALRFLFNWKLQLLFAESSENVVNESVQPNGTHPQQAFIPDMHWREISFAYHSTTQQPLLNILILHYDNKLTWQIARKLGIMAWLSEREALEQVFEQMGQTAYRSEQPPDPVNATLYYLALHKKQTLLALWRIATWHREQRTTMNFLKRDFGQADARTAAKKNAYALMGKRRFHYAAAFFLLADDPASATSVLAGQCEDSQFAIAVARLYCGDGSPVLRRLLEDRVMLQAKLSGDRWLMSWCHSVLLEKGLAAEVLVKPLGGVKRWQQDDPLTLLLYKQLRKIPSEHEYDAILRSARILRRMGLWLLALELVRNWEFKSVTPAATNAAVNTNGLSNGVHNDPLSSLDDFSQPEPPKAVDEKASREAKAAELLAKLKAKKEGTTSPATVTVQEKKKPEPTQFKEPDPSSLLDDFGF